MHYHGRFQHLHHEGGFAAGDVVGCANACEDLVEPAEAGLGGRHERACLRHQHYECRLPQKGRLTRHVGPREYHYLRGRRVHMDVVRHILFAGRHERLNHGVPCALEVQHGAAIHYRPTVAAVHGLPREALQHVQLRQHPAVRLNVAYPFLHLGHKAGIQLAFEGQDGVFRTKDLLLVGLELFGDIAFRVHQRLLAVPFRRHLVAGRITHFEVVAEHAVIAYLEAADAGSFGLAVLQVQQVVLAAGGDVAERIQFLAHAAGDDFALAYLHCRVLRERCGDAGEQTATVLHALQQFQQSLRNDFAGALVAKIAVFATNPRLRPGVSRVFGRKCYQTLASGSAQCLDRLHLLQRPAQLQHFPGQNLAGRCAGNDPFEVAHVFQQTAEFLQQLFVAGEIPHNVVAVVQCDTVEYGHRQPASQQTGTHRRAAAVQHIHQRHSVAARVTLEYFQVADGEAVHPDELAFFDSGDAADIAEAGVLRLFEVHQKRTGSAEGQRIRVDAEAFEAACAELLFEPFFGGLLHKGPFFDRADVDAGELLRCAAVKVPADDKFLGGEGADESFDVFKTALRHLESSGGDVQERCPDGTVGVEFQAAEEVVFLLLEHAFGEGHAGREDLRDAALHQFALGELRVFQLVAHGNLVACPHQFGKILLQGVMRHSGHLGGTLFAVGAMGEHQA